MADELGAELGVDRTLLLVDDDEPFVKRLAKAMEQRGFLPETAGSVAAGRAIDLTRPSAYAVVDLRHWYPSGGIPIDVSWQTGKLPSGLWVPEQGVAPYRGRG